MARTRNLKPAFFKNEDLADLDPLARLLFQGLWCHADRDGRLEDRPRRLKMEILPYDDCDVDQLLQGLTDSPGKFILRYEAEGNRYIAIPQFSAHQNPHQAEKSLDIPPPPDLHDTSTRQALDKNSSKRALSLNPYPLTLIPSSVSLPPLSGRLPSDRSAASSATRDQKEVDWNEARAQAQRYSQRVVGSIEWTPANRRLLLEACALVQLDRLPERWLVDSLEGLKHAPKRPKSPGGYLTSCLTNMAIKQFKRDFKQLRTEITVPDEIMERKPGEQLGKE